jgi:hypothetical protein
MKEEHIEARHTGQNASPETQAITLRLDRKSFWQNHAWQRVMAEGQAFSHDPPAFNLCGFGRVLEEPGMASYPSSMKDSEWGILETLLPPKPDTLRGLAGAGLRESLKLEEIEFQQFGNDVRLRGVVRT